MATSPNQRIVRINKEPCGTTNLYAKINLDAMKSAMIDLTNAEFQMWLYFAKNQNNYDLVLSQVNAEKWGISKSTYHRAINTLIVKKYLVSKGVGSNRFDFIEMPKKIFK